MKMRYTSAGYLDR